MLLFLSAPSLWSANETGDFQKESGKELILYSLLKLCDWISMLEK